MEHDNEGVLYHTIYLVAGDLFKTIQIQYSYPATMEPQSHDVLRAFNKISYNSAFFKALPYVFNTRGTEFQVIKNQKDVLTCNSTRDRTKEKPKLQVPPYENGVTAGINQNRGLKITSIAPITHAQMKGFEVIGNFENNDGSVKLYYEYVLLSPNHIPYKIVGSADENFANHLETFRKISKTFRYKLKGRD